MKNPLLYCMAIAGVFSIALAGCAPAPSQSSTEAEPSAVDKDSITSCPAQSRRPSGEEVLDKASELYEGLSDELSEYLTSRENAAPQHYELGEEGTATKNLACTVVEVEEGPLNYRRDPVGSPTVKVTVLMRNLSSKPVLVKPSNWSADAVTGERVGHLGTVVGKDGKVVSRSFSLKTRVSPGKTLEAVVFFPAQRLSAVLYEPHFLISAESECLFWDIG